MKTILVPVDFSKNSENALRYALMLSDKWHARLILFHSFHSYHSSGYSSAIEGAKGVEAGHSVAKEKLTELYESLSLNNGQEIEYLSSPHELLDEILHIVKEKQVDLIVMGTQGIGRLAGKFLGTNASWVVEYATCPVIVVPEADITYDMKHISYASGYQKADIPNLKILAGMASLFQAALTVVHVTPYQTTEEKHAFMLFEKSVHDEISSPEITFKTLPGSNVEETLEAYLKQHQADLLVLSARQRDLFDKVFGKSVTQVLTLHLQAPIMVFHHQKS